MTEPRTWRVSKVNRLSANGLAMITLAQTQFNATTDYIEHEDAEDDSSPVIGMWADYFADGVEPVVREEEVSFDRIVVTHTGAAHRMKIGGSAKVFTATFYAGEEEVAPKPGRWDFSIGGADAADLVEVIPNAELSANQAEVRLLADETFLGQNLTVSFVADSGRSGSVVMDIAGL